MSKAPGASPAAAAAAARTPARTRLYRDGVRALEDFPAKDISGYLAAPGPVAWLDLCAPAAADFTTVNAGFGLHELAIEDALRERQRPSPTATPVTCSPAPTRPASTPRPAS